MNDKSQNSNPKKPRLVSIRFLVIAVVLGVVGYFTVPWIMFQVMVMQEKATAEAGAIEAKKAYDLKEKNRLAESETGADGEGETLQPEESTPPPTDDGDSNK